MKESEILAQVRAEMKELDFEVVEDAKEPLVLVRATVVSSRDKTDACALVFFIEVQQGVRVLRINQDLEVPTTTLFGATICSVDQLAAEAKQQAVPLIRKLGKAVQHAGAVRKDE